MSSLSSIVNQDTPPRMETPRYYNAATEFIDRHLKEGRGEHIAFIDDVGQCSYQGLAERVNRAGNALRALGVRMEERVLICLHDTIDFPTVFWGALKIGAIPIPVNTLLTSHDYDYMLRDSRACALVISAALYEVFQPILSTQPFLRTVLVSGKKIENTLNLDEHCRLASQTLDAAETTADDIGFWLYTSGSTGAPKGSLHLHASLAQTAVLYGEGVLGIRSEDIVFSAAKLFFAYGLGNAMTFPLYVGATSVLMAERPTPESVMHRLKAQKPTIFYGVPTLYGAILATDEHPIVPGDLSLRRCVSAGEALPEGVARVWEERFGVPILDGLGSTEMLHIFLSNRADDIRYGTTGKVVPGYELRLVDEHDQPVAKGDIGELCVKGPSSAMAYWNQRGKSLRTFQGPWTYTGDKYIELPEGYFQYCGRTDDMLKVGGIWVSPFEVEAVLIKHEAVLEAAVIGQADERGLIKPKALVVLNSPRVDPEALIPLLQDFVKSRLAPYKYPRWIEFADSLPKTATGKIQRFKLRA